MASIGEKVAHVARAGQTRDHTCHWPGCGAQVPPAMWGCKKHWFKLPKHLQRRIWQTYQPGQEEGDADVSGDYLDAADEVQKWIHSNYPNG